MHDTLDTMRVTEFLSLLLTNGWPSSIERFELAFHVLTDAPAALHRNYSRQHRNYSRQHERVQKTSNIGAQADTARRSGASRVFSLSTVCRSK
jgi:hypothetical protein